MGERSPDDLSAESVHNGMLEQVLGSAASESLVYSYKKSFNGFAAKLSQDEMQKIAGMEGVVSVFPSKTKQLHTTRSWDFMGFSQKVSRSAFESDVIVGMIDTGVWPESDSFKDDGFGPPPSKWKGICQSPANFTCNNKLIGARFYHTDGKLPEGEINSPRDSEGHGTHTASTATGRLVSGASLLGLGEGTARGAVPSARIAAYKVCWSDGCADADILAAFDDAIADGVDIISISVGGFGPVDYFQDSIAIGAFHAMERGILTSNSAGNSGPGPSTVSNYSPWTLTVAASSIDRQFLTRLVLGNNKTYEGPSINTFNLGDQLYPLVYAGNVPNTSAGYDGSESRFCGAGTLDGGLVKGKIVLCDGLHAGVGPLLADAMGAIMQDDLNSDDAFVFPLPLTVLSVKSGSEVFQYINTTRNSTANILKSTAVKNQIAPVVVSFSSRGPNPITSDILKPDLTAPGVEILAAWSPIASMSVYGGDPRSVSYNIISGTSMSCPHATGAAAYIKSFHPTWSPAAIKSALMTTAYPMTAATNTDAEFAYGAGHINPVLAINPGLVYDAGARDYIEMLCKQGYTTNMLRLVTGDNSTCTNTANGTVWDLNYPSIALTVPLGISFVGSFNRTVTNVGSENSVYNGNVWGPPGVTLSVTPSVLTFKSIGESQSFVVKVEGKISKSMVSGSLVWNDGVRRVRSPIVVYSSDA
ncbi:cucumisin-like [Magnolia sinica]|uniref:cucumisin-like n=1 Tax=Magnolia sinica TaxID=86752 RepID=UPI0026591670|nr:cucumisin-like [Magnolia sinica]